MPACLADGHPGKVGVFKPRARDCTKGVREIVVAVVQVGDAIAVGVVGQRLPRRRKFLRSGHGLDDGFARAVRRQPIGAELQLQLLDAFRTGIVFTEDGQCSNNFFGRNAQFCASGGYLAEGAIHDRGS
ncbi:hypothetical protein BOC44_20920 (plasmid) [Burkholderia pseudomallei]|nr:hypothetical protein BOC44_20920 [Burkholderia pseudomallei]